MTTERERYEPPVPGPTKRRNRLPKTTPEQHALQHRVQRAAKRMLRDKYPAEYEAFMAKERFDADGNRVVSYNASARAYSRLAYLHREEVAEMRAAIWKEIRASKSED